MGAGTVQEMKQREKALTQDELTYNQRIYDYLSNRADLEYPMGAEK